jgi:hypothetical protein
MHIQKKKTSIQNHDFWSHKFRGPTSHQSVAKHRHCCKSIKDFSRFNTFHEHPVFMDQLFSELMVMGSIRRHVTKHIIFNYRIINRGVAGGKGERVTEAWLYPAICLFIKIIHKLTTGHIYRYWNTSISHQPQVKQSQISKPDVRKISCRTVIPNQFFFFLLACPLAAHFYKLYLSY